MATVKAFRGMRFSEHAGSIEELVCPPYDIISEEQRAAYLQRNPNNVIRLELPREGENPYEAAGRVLDEWLSSGVLALDARPGFYIYEIGFSHRGIPMSLKGVIGRVKLEPFENGIILPHEETLSKAKADRFELMKATGCNFSQIYSLYMDPAKEISGRLEQASAGMPAVSFTDEDGLTQKLWIETDPAVVGALEKAFADKKLYIADGHHRYETALHYRDWMREQGRAKEGDGCDYAMMMLVAMEHPGLVVYPTHRIVRGMKGFQAGEILQSCGEYFRMVKMPGASLSQVEAALDAAYAIGEKAFAFYDGNFTLLTLKDLSVMEALLPGTSRALRELDVSVLHTLVLERLMGIDRENMASQKNLTYTKAPSEAVAAVDHGEGNCAFLLNPTRVTEIRDVALAGEKMPQKSTYFYPKLTTGLVMNRF